MANPNRRSGSAIVPRDFFRADVQKVIRAYLKKGATAVQCSRMFNSVRFCLRKEEIHDEAKLADIGDAAYSETEFFAALVLAMKKAELRHAELPANHPEKIIDVHERQLADPKHFPKWASAVGKNGMKAKQLASLRAHISAWKKKERDWMDKVIMESDAV